MRAIVSSGALRSPRLLATGAIAGIVASIAADGTAGVIWSGTEAGGWPAIRLAYDGSPSAADELSPLGGERVWLLALDQSAPCAAPVFSVVSHRMSAPRASRR